MRLVRPGMESEYERANAAFRDAARQLGPLRDAHALLATFDEMVSASPVDADEFSSVRAALSREVEHVNGRSDVGERIGRAAELINAGAGRKPRWEIDDPVGAIEAAVKNVRPGSPPALELGGERFSPSST